MSLHLGLLLEMAASGHGERAAIRQHGDTTTFEVLADRTARGASLLKRSGARHVLFLGRNGAVVPRLLFAAGHAGIPFVPLNYRLSAASLDELAARLPSALLVHDEEYGDLISAVSARMSSEEFMAGSAEVDPIDPHAPDDDAVAVILFTSGTTARPKAVLLRHDNLCSYILGTVEYGSADPGDTALVTVPPYHVAAIASVLSNVYAGRAVAYLPDFSAAGWLDTVVAERVTSAMVVPTMLARIVAEIESGRAAPVTLRQLSYGGARMPRPVLEAALRLLPQTGFTNAYGLTETSSTVALLGPDEHRAFMASEVEAERERLGSVGRAVPGIDTQIRDDAGAVMRAGEVGELWVRGPQVSGMYMEVGATLDDEGWFPTRDRAMIDDEGYLFILGRSDDTIIRGGENLFPGEIEDALVQHPGVADAAVVGRADDDWGERTVAVLVASGDPVDPDEIRAFVRGLLRGSRVPDEIVWTDALPYTPTGKLVRREVRAAIGKAVR